MNAPDGCVLPKPKPGIGTGENSFDRKNKNGIRSRFLWKSGIGYARTHGNSERRGVVPEKYRERSRQTKGACLQHPKGCPNIPYYKAGSAKAL